MTKTRYLLIGAVISLLTLWGCDDNSDYVIGSNPNEFAINPVAIPVSADGGTYELTVTGNESWTAKLTESNSSAQDWCTLSATSGTGKTVITLTVKPSTSFVKNRSLLIEVSGGNKTLKSRVLQETMVLGEDEILINGMVYQERRLSRNIRKLSRRDRTVVSVQPQSGLSHRPAGRPRTGQLARRLYERQHQLADGERSFTRRLARAHHTRNGSPMGKRSNMGDSRPNRLQG
ncbi:BACON domain-containing protein [Bacteroides stercorirosoris]|uniref:BACON domain-containing protein n=1 Tax=Bacteroides stercorirosoris TaxID=871324 RepID=UPI0023FA2816|nr:BACON domain-containing protein [Bacteroides stercorirosoris]